MKKITLNEAMEAIRMVLDAASEAGLSDKEICDAIDWKCLESLDNAFSLDTLNQNG